LREIGKYADQMKVETGRVLAHEEKKGWEFIFIVYGKARVEKGRKVNRQRSEGDFLGEISLIVG
jgi:hypothetical protein